MPEGSTPPIFHPTGQPAPMQLPQQESSEGESRAIKRARASRPKVKSGCITCKTRRVKCDETKPQCLRCLKFGRTCDGYPEPPSGRGVAIVPIQPRIPSVSLYSPSVSLHATEEEYRYFQVFRERSAYELSGFFSNDFWTTLVMQESHAITPIRHAVVAMGALNMSLESAPGPQLKVNVIQSVDKKHHENAVLHYLKAIQALNQYISTSTSPQLRVALISCLLFVCFETFQGSYASSVQQTYGGLKILRSYYIGKPGSRPWIPRRALADSSIVEARNINKALQIRVGCDNVSKERAMTTHVEEYLGMNIQPQLDTEDSIVTKVRTPPIQMTESFVYDPLAAHVGIPFTHMTGTDLNKEQQDTVMAVSPEERSIYASDSVPLARSRLSSTPARPQSNILPDFGSTPEQSPMVLKTSSSISNSAASTPAAHTPAHRPQEPMPSNDAAAQQLSSNRKRSLASRGLSSPVLQNDLTIEESLIQTFVRLDGQGLFFGMIPGIPPLIWDIHKSYHIPIPDVFEDFSSAQRCWDFLMDRALQFFRRTLFDRTYAPSNSESPAQVARQHASYIRQLSDFDRAFRPILKDAIDSDGSISNPAALVLSLYQKITVITLATVRTDSEMVYDTFLPDFQYITRTCTMLIASQDVTQLPRNTRFSFEVGVVPPLHVTATKCRDPLTRRAAVELLFASPRQEGMWDGVLTARIGKWITSCEEDGLPPPPLESRESSICRSPSECDSLAQERLNYPSPPDIPDEPILAAGAWDNGTKISQSVSDVVARGGLTEYASQSEGGAMINSVGLRPGVEVAGTGKKRMGSAVTKKEPVPQDREWIVPEENRVQLMVVDFHIPDRYIKVKCQKALLREDGSREERETVIAW